MAQVDRAVAETGNRKEWCEITQTDLCYNNAGDIPMIADGPLSVLRFRHEAPVMRLMERHL